MIFNILIVDDEDSQAKSIEKYIASYVPLCNKLLKITFTFSITLITGRNAYNLAKVRLENNNIFHIVFSDERLCNNSGFEILQSIDVNVYTTYRVLFSQYHQSSNKQYHNDKIRFVNSKEIEGVFLALLHFEEKILFEKFYGYSKYFDAVYNIKKSYKNETQIIDSGLKEISKEFNTVRYTLSPSIYSDNSKIFENYLQVVKQLPFYEVSIKPDFLFESFDKNSKAGIKKIETKIGLDTLILVIKDSPKDSLFLRNSLDSPLKIYRILAAVKTIIKEKVQDNQVDKEKVLKVILYDTKPYIYNLLWVSPSENAVEVINFSNKKIWIKVPYLEKFKMLYKFHNLFFKK